MKWFMGLLQTVLIVTMSLNRSEVQPGERFSAVVVITGNTSTEIAMFSQASLELESMIVFGSPDGTGVCNYQDRGNVCFAAIGASPVLVVATYYVKPNASKGDHIIRAEIDDLNIGAQQVVERVIRVGIVEQPAPPSPQVRQRFAIVFR